MEMIITKERERVLQMKMHFPIWQSYLGLVLQSGLHPIRTELLEEKTRLAMPDPLSWKEGHLDAKAQPFTLATNPPWTHHLPTGLYTCLLADFFLWICISWCHSPTRMHSTCLPRVTQHCPLLLPRRCLPHLTVSVLWVPSSLSCWFWRALGPITVDSREMFSIESLEPGINTECRGHVMISLASPPFALHLEWAPDFPWGGLLHCQSGSKFGPRHAQSVQPLSNSSRESSDWRTKAEFSWGQLQERMAPGKDSPYFLTRPGSPSCQGQSLSFIFNSESCPSVQSILFMLKLTRVHFCCLQPKDSYWHKHIYEWLQDGLG